MQISRRNFLKLALLSLSGFGFRSPEGGFEPLPAPGSHPDRSRGAVFGRITRQGTPVYQQADIASQHLEKLERDALVELPETLQSPAGPAHNPRWYRLPPQTGQPDRFVHSAYVQRVDDSHYNLPLSEVPAGGCLGEITVPFSLTLYLNREEEWINLYRLYYGTVHWITGLEKRPSGEKYYRLTDERLRVHYWVRASHVRPISPDELSPLSPEIPLQSKRLKVSIERQILTAFEGREKVREIKVSTGQRYTPTRPGDFRVDRKYPCRHMGNGVLTADLRAYELVGVPWVSFFATNGIAFHGTYWHDNFGAPMSRGCVNLPNPEALWLFRWTAPSYSLKPGDRPTWKVTGKEGTPVVVVE